MNQHRWRMLKLGMFFIFCVLSPFLFTLLFSFLNIGNPSEGTLTYLLILIVWYGWPLFILTSALLWLFCGYSKKPPSAVWLAVVITVIVTTAFAVVGFGFNDAPPMSGLDLPDWIYGIGFLSCAAITIWLPSTKPFAVLRDHRPDLILLILLSIPPLFLLFLGFISVASMIAADM